jgi:hypothetical protein
MLRFLRLLLFFACTPPPGHRNRTEGNEGNEEAARCDRIDEVGASPGPDYIWLMKNATVPLDRDRP